MRFLVKINFFFFRFLFRLEAIMKLYIITRADLKPGARAAQSAHAAFAFAAKHPKVCSGWMADSNNLVLLEVDSEPELWALVRDAHKEDVPHVAFHEPDFGDQLTAVALGPAGSRLVSRFRLCLRDAA